MKPHFRALLPTSTHCCCLHRSPHLPSTSLVRGHSRGTLVASSYLWASVLTLQCSEEGEGREPLPRLGDDISSLGAWACFLIRRKSYCSFKGGASCLHSPTHRQVSLSLSSKAPSLNQSPKQKVQYDALGEPLKFCFVLFCF